MTRLIILHCSRSEKCKHVKFNNINDSFYIKEKNYKTKLFVGQSARSYYYKTIYQMPQIIENIISLHQTFSELLASTARSEDAKARDI